ncbi:hypothetical protein AB6880_05090 [Rahnella inusitata]|uniref:hypothetical protein n=1 Tax=Rahnella inusitata TaxID=58169 RepID=UPI0039BDFA73
MIIIEKKCYYTIKNKVAKKNFVGILLSLFVIFSLPAESIQNITPTEINNATSKNESLDIDKHLKSLKENDAANKKPTEEMTKLTLNEIIIDIDDPGDYVFGIYPNDNKNKVSLDGGNIVMPLGFIDFYDVVNKKLISTIDISSNGGIYGNRVNDMDGIMFRVKFEKKSVYLITPKIYVKTKNNINTTYSLSIHHIGFVK